jgi:RHS repeat-associated protein
LYLSERNIYGSSRLGMENVNYLIASSNAGNIEAYAHENVVVGDKAFELADHRGNVNVVVTDRKLGVDSDNNGVVDYYTADVVGYADYYPFGMLMPNRHGGTLGRYGFNGMESDDEVSGAKNSYDFGARLYNPRIARWLSTDAYESKYPSSTPYNFAVNNPLLFIDPDGNDNVIYLIYHHDNENPDLKGVTANSIRDEANKMYEKLGLETRVVVFDDTKMGKFNPEYMDKTDAYAVVGDFEQISAETGLKFGSTGLGMSKNGGIAAGVLTTNISKFKDLPTSSVAQLLAFGLIHETGHLASTDVNNPDHSQFQDKPKYQANFMSVGAIIEIIFSSPDTDSKGFRQSEDGGNIDEKQTKSHRNDNKNIKGLMDLFDPIINETNIKNFKIKFKNNTSRDNYQKNELLKEEGINIGRGAVSEPVIVTP